MSVHYANWSHPIQLIQHIHNFFLFIELEVGVVAVLDVIYFSTSIKNTRFINTSVMEVGIFNWKTLKSNFKMVCYFVLIFIRNAFNVSPFSTSILAQLQSEWLHFQVLIIADMFIVTICNFNVTIQWNLVTRTLGPWKLPCYIKFLTVSG